MAYRNKKKKRKKGQFRRFLYVALLAINILVGSPLLFSFLAQYIPPSTSKYVAFSGIAFPYLLVANCIICFLWIFVRYQYLIISLTLILLNTNTIDKHYQFKAVEKPQKCAQCIKVMSYNVRLFDLYNPTPSEFGKGKEKIFNYLKTEKPDIVCFQEYFLDKGNKLNFFTTDSILSTLELQNDERYYYQYFPNNLRNEYFYGLAIFTKYRIVNNGIVELEKGSNNIAIYADIKYRSDTIRIYSIHLTSIHLDKIDYETGKYFSQNLNDPNLSKKTKNIYLKLDVAFKKRELQVKMLKNHIDSCRFPIILCGDFNDTPASYAYNQLAKKFKDTFRESGQGEGITYHGDAFPQYRIDYILYDKRYKSYGHTVTNSIKVSDHFPIFSYISLQK